MRDIRVASVQFQHHPGDTSANLGRVRFFLEEAATAGAEMIIFPEMCLTGYWHVRHLTDNEVRTLAEPIPDGPCSTQLREWARQFQMTIGAGLIEVTPDGTLHNSYLVAMPDGSYACHRKLHAFIHPLIQSGDQYTVFDTPHGCRVGVLTCYDNNIVENVRITALLGAEILFAPHQTGGCRSRSPHAMGPIDPILWHRRHEDPAAIEAELNGPKGRGWLMRWLPARAHDNGLFLLFSNGVGVDDDEVRTGNAMILDPYGRILVETGRAADEMVVADLDASLQPTSTGRRWIQTRRPSLYAPLTQPTGKERDTRIVRFQE
jgi:predicted amidohydrolase